MIIPVWNTPIELEKTLRSLERQTFKDFEVIVVDDGSTEFIDSVISNFKFSSFKLGFYEIKHGGAPRARNFGFSKSQGEYILFCDADIELDPTCLVSMKKVLDEKSEIDFVYSDFKYGWKKFEFWKFDVKKLKQNNYINTCSMVRREKVVKWDENLMRFQDWDFWLTVVEQGGRGEYIPEVLFKANVRRGTISNWLPSFMYRFSRLGRVKEYKKLKKIVREKHKNMKT